MINSKKEDYLLIAQEVSASIKYLHYYVSVEVSSDNPLKKELTQCIRDFEKIDYLYRKEVIKDMDAADKEEIYQSLL